MCGIIGFTGRRGCAGFLLEGLERLEYRGYDSAGVAFARPQGLVLGFEVFLVTSPIRYRLFSPFAARSMATKA